MTPDGARSVRSTPQAAVAGRTTASRIDRLARRREIPSGRLTLLQRGMFVEVWRVPASPGRFRQKARRKDVFAKLHARSSTPMERISGR